MRRPRLFTACASANRYASFATFPDAITMIEQDATTAALHHEPPLVDCEDCQVALRAHASRVVCSALSPTLAKRAPRNPTPSDFDLNFHARLSAFYAVGETGHLPLAQGGSISRVPSLSTDTTDDDTIPEQFPIRQPARAVDLAEGFYQKPNSIIQSPRPLYHPRPRCPMTKNAIAWLETRPSCHVWNKLPPSSPQPIQVQRYDAMVVPRSTLSQKLQKHSQRSTAATAGAGLVTNASIDLSLYVDDDVPGLIDVLYTIGVDDAGLDVAAAGPGSTSVISASIWMDTSTSAHGQGSEKPPKRGPAPAHE